MKTPRNLELDTDREIRRSTMWLIALAIVSAVVVVCL